ncbi:MAG: SDR family NAD(P)-dependent oxidoreductase [Myxococcales bacterium]|nr:SDR family NAD(P)-dependent oxidoreductase [Myxococcales bacterium]
MANELNGKVFLVTGATEGIGKAAALEFAKRGATLVLVGRNKEKSERVVADLKSQSQNDKIDLLLGDMSKLADVRAVAAAFSKKYDRLDVLVNNAGAYFADYKLSPDGYEQTFALNHLGYFLLTHELLPLLRKTSGARVVSTSSAAHQTGKMDLQTIAKRDGKSAGFSAYGDSKLCNILFTRTLAQREKGIAINCFHPGFVQTGFGQNNEGLMSSLIRVTAKLFARTPEKGAETLIWLATSSDAAKLSGEYCFDCKPHKSTKLAQDMTVAEGLWSLSEKLCGVSS